jgi:hypothetical protein
MMCQTADLWLVFSAACVTNSAATPNSFVCDLGASTVWNSGDTVEITVPVVAGLSSATNAINTATVTDDQNRTTSDTFPVNINVDPTVSAADCYAAVQPVFDACSMLCNMFVAVNVLDCNTTSSRTLHQACGLRL